MSERARSPQLVRKAPGFVAGLAHPFRAIGFVAQTPSTWPLALVPAVLFALLATAAAVAGVVWLTPWVLSLLPGLEGGWATAAEWLTRLVTFASSLALGVWVALLLTPPLSGPALERLVQIQERALFVPERAEAGFLRDLWIGAQAQLIAVCFAVPVLVALWLVQLVFPVAAVVTAPLSVLVTSMALAWNLFDYPLTLRGVRASARLGFVFGHWKPLLGFSLAFAALFSVPCLGVLMLPIGVVGATRLLYALLEADPEQLAELPRPTQAALPEPSALGGQAWAEPRPVGQDSDEAAEFSRRR